MGRRDRLKRGGEESWAKNVGEERKRNYAFSFKKLFELFYAEGLNNLLIQIKFESESLDNHST